MDVQHINNIRAHAAAYRKQARELVRLAQECEAKEQFQTARKLRQHAFTKRLCAKLVEGTIKRMHKAQ